MSKTGVERLRGLYVEWIGGDYLVALSDMIQETADQIEREQAEELAALEPRLMPESMEWPRFEDGEKVGIGDAILSPENGLEGTVAGVNCFAEEWFISFVGHGFGSEMLEVGKRLKRPAPPDTQERIDEDVCKVADACTYFSSDGSCVKCKLVSQYGDADSAYEECPKSVELEQMAILDLLRRQRELDARTMGGE